MTDKSILETRLRLARDRIDRARSRCLLDSNEEADRIFHVAYEDWFDLYQEYQLLNRESKDD